MNPLATRFELVHYFRIARPIVVAVDVELLPNVIKATQELGSSPAIVVIDHSPSASHCYAVASVAVLISLPTQSNTTTVPSRLQDGRFLNFAAIRPV